MLKSTLGEKAFTWTLIPDQLMKDPVNSERDDAIEELLGRLKKRFETGGIPGEPFTKIYYCHQPR